MPVLNINSYTSSSLEGALVRAKNNTSFSYAKGIELGIIHTSFLSRVSAGKPYVNVFVVILDVDERARVAAIGRGWWSPFDDFEIVGYDKDLFHHIRRQGREPGRFYDLGEYWRRERCQR
jgi:hypothetical protein